MRVSHQSAVGTAAALTALSSQVGPGVPLDEPLLLGTAAVAALGAGALSFVTVRRRHHQERRRRVAVTYRPRPLQRWEP